MDGLTGREGDVGKRPPFPAADEQDPAAATDDAAQVAVLRRFTGAVLTVYWLTLMIATHIPLRHARGPIPQADKVAHFVGYGILGLLLAFFVALRRPLTIGTALLLTATIALYGAADELLQIPVGRTCDVLDWICDVIGGGIGVLTVVVLSRLHPRNRPPAPHTNAIDADEI